MGSKFSKHSFILLGLLVGASSSFSIPGISGEISVGVMNQEPSGYIQYQGDKIDIEEDFGIGKKSRYFVRAKLEVPVLPNLYLQAIPMEFSGTSNRTVTYGNRTFTGTVESYIRMNHYDVGLYYNLPFLSMGGIIDPEIGLNVRVIDFEGTVTGTVGNQTERESKAITIPVPMVYAGLGINLPYITLIGEVRGVTYSGHRYYDLTGEIRLKPLSLPVVGSFFIGVGYRYEELRLENLDDVSSGIKIKGLFANMGLSF